MKERSCPWEFCEEKKWHCPPDEARKKNYGIGATEVAVVCSAHPHLGGTRPCFEWPETKSATLKSVPEPLGESAAEPAFAVIKDPAAKRNGFCRRGAGSRRSDHEDSGLNFVHAQDLERFVPELGQFKDGRGG